jgi:CDGSH-type Zn-finger protein
VDCEGDVNEARISSNRDNLTKVRASADGPLLVSGGARILDAEGTVLYEGEKAALCRCGGSGNKPFCDGTHTKLGQVEPWPNERTELQDVAGTDQIPVLQTDDGRLYRGTREIFAHLHEREPWRFAAAHRRRLADHRDARESDAPGQLIEYFRITELCDDPSCCSRFSTRSVTRRSCD